MNEADHKRKLVAEVNGLRGGWARRVEDRWAVGVLDLIIKLPTQLIVFAEGKLVDGNVFGPTERQWVEGERIRAAGLDVVLIGWRDGITYVSPWVKQADRRNCISGIDQIRTIKEHLNESRRTPAR
jgi:hypothetical protein